MSTASADDVWFLGTHMRVVPAAASDGAMALIEQRADRGFSPPRHVHHREDTAIYLIAGELTVEVGDTTSSLRAGGFVWLPRDVPHTFRVESVTCHLIELVTPGGFEGFHVEAGDPAVGERPPHGEPDVGRLLSAIGGYGAEIVGPPMSVG